MLLVFSSIDGFVLKSLLHVNMGSKCCSSLYEAFQMENKSWKGPIYICRTSFYLLTEVKLGMIKLKTFLVHTQAWFTRTTLANPSRRKCRKSSLLPCNLYNLCADRLHCITSLRKSFLYHLYDFHRTSMASSC